MKRNEAALISAGGLTHSFLTRCPAIIRRLGPIKGTSFRVARRIASSLRAGYAVPDYRALEGCTPVWIAVSDPLLDGVIRDFALQAPLAGMVVVLCDSLYDARWAHPLQSAHAQVATLNAVEASSERIFVAEGHPEAIRELRRAMAGEKRKLIELKPGAKPIYLSGVRMASEQLVPWIVSAVDALRTAGLARSDAAHVAEALAMQAVHSLKRTGRNTLRPPRPEDIGRSSQREIETLQRALRLAADAHHP